MLIRVNVAEECDARDDDSSNAAGIKRKIRIQKIFELIICNPAAVFHGPVRTGLRRTLVRPVFMASFGRADVRGLINSAS